MDSIQSDLGEILRGLPAVDPGWYHNPGGIHGPSHTVRVLIHAQSIAEELELGAREREAVLLAALWHDIGRVHDGLDRHHGARSTGKVLGLGLHEPFDDELIRTVFFAMEYHSIRDKWAEDAAIYTPDSAWSLQTLWVLKDADGLDRVRLGDLDSGQLRHECAKGMVDDAWMLLEVLS